MIYSTIHQLLTTLMLPTKLKSTLKAIQKECTKNIYDLNSGGCGVFAHLVCKQLVLIGIEAEVITTASKRKYSPKNVKGNDWNKREKASCEVWDSNGLDRSHVGVRFKYNGVVFTYDSVKLRMGSKSFGVYGDGKWKCNYPFGEGMSYKEMKKLVDDVPYWNPEFDRKQIPTVKKIVKEAFKAMKV